MRITDSTIALSTTRAYSRTTAREERVRLWVGPPPQRPERLSSADSASLSVEGRAKIAGPACGSEGDDAPTVALDSHQTLLIALVEALTGHKVHISGLDQTASDATRATEERAAAICAAGTATTATTPAGSPAQALQRAGWGMTVDVREMEAEEETTSFQAAAIIRTADGRQIAATISLEMSRSFAAERELHLRFGDAALKDPLVLNFSGKAAELMDIKISFDLDADGAAEEMPVLAAGSAMLFIDRNGDGFADLAAHDSDGNGWIDEGDAVFDALRLWQPSAIGAGTMQTLREAGVGAIALASADTQFDLKDAGNALQGRSRETVLFLYEQGGVGTAQQIDLAV